MRLTFYLYVFTLLFISAQSLQSQVFTEVAIEAGMYHVFHVGDVYFGGGAAVLDIDGDEWEDVFVAGGAHTDKLYRNNGDGTFTDVLEGSGLEVMELILTMGAIAGDIDNDGDKDLYVSTRASLSDLDEYVPNYLFLNNGDGTFTDISTSSNISRDAAFSTSATFGDVNNDGYLDIYVGNFLGEPVDEILGEDGLPLPGDTYAGADNFLYINNGDLTFTNIAEEVGVINDGTAWSVAFSDYDNDHDVDLHIANDFGMLVRPNALYRNDGDGTFTDVSEESNTDIPMLGMGIAIGDYNEDGWFDYYVTNFNTNVLLKNNQDGTFENVANESGVEDSGWEILDKSTGEMGFVAAIGWGTNFFDYDHDSYLDLFVANGSLNPLVEGGTTVDTSYNLNTLYRNTGNGDFELVQNSGVGHDTRSRGSVYFDYDRDGDLDMLVVVQNNFSGYTSVDETYTLLYRNDSENNFNWLKVKTIGTEQNYDGIGARVSIRMGDRTLIREVEGGSSHISSNSSIVHFGLGTNDQIDELKVTWLGGKTQTFTNIPINETVVITEDEDDLGVVAIEDYVFSREIKIYPNPQFAAHNNGFTLQIADFTSNEDLQWEILTLDGRVLQNIPVTDAQQFIATRGWNSGLYYVQLKKGERVVGVEKLVVY